MGGGGGEKQGHQKVCLSTSVVEVTALFLFNNGFS